MSRLYDVILHTFYELVRIPKWLPYYLFLSPKTFDLSVKEIIETVAIKIIIKSQYEKHYKQSWAIPSKNAGDIYLYSNIDPQFNWVSHWTPKPYNFIEGKTLILARKDTAKHVTCTCQGGYRICPNCDGGGYVRCHSCGGSGHCPRCRGKGYIYIGFSDKEETCPQCNGSGQDDFCGGTGKLRCPTCEGSGSVVCPICGGSGSVFLYTEDIFKFYCETDEVNVVPPVLKSKRKELNKAMANISRGIHIKKIDYLDVTNAIGKRNIYVSDILDLAKRELDALRNEIRSREKDMPLSFSISSLQEEAFEKVNRILEESWRRTRKNYYYSKFKMNLEPSERSVRSDILSIRLLFSEETYYVFPVSVAVCQRGRKRTAVISVGYDSTYLSRVYTYSWSKIFLFILLSALIPLIMLHENLLYWAIFLIALAFYVLLISRSIITQKLVVILGYDDVKNAVLMFVIANILAQKDIGIIDDSLIDAKIVKTVFSGKFWFSNSIGFTLKIKDKYLRVIAISSNALRNLRLYGEKIEFLMNRADIIVCSDKNTVDRIDMIGEIIRNTKAKTVLVSDYDSNDIFDIVVPLDMNNVVSLAKLAKWNQISNLGLNKLIDEILSIL